MNLDPRRGWTDLRVLKALAMSPGDISAAVAFAQGQAWRDTPQVPEILMASIAGGTTTGDGAGLVGPQSNDLLSIIRPATVIGRLQGLKRVPFDSALTAMTGGTSAAWVGEGKSVPLSKATFSRLATPLGRLKITAMCVEDAELVRSSDPDSVVTISKDFIAACIAAADLGFVDGGAAVPGVRPASVFNGSPAFASGGSTALLIDVDLEKLLDSLLARGSTLEFAHWIIHPITAAFLARLRNANGDYAYPLVTVKGGTLMGMPVVVSASVPHGGSPSIASILLVDASRIWLAEEPAMAFDVAAAATLQMLDNPTQDVTTPTATTQVSLFQTGSLALRGTRMLNFKISDVGFAAVLNGLVD